MALPKAGAPDNNERYLIPAVTVPPTLVSEEAGMIVGIPEPASTNMGQATLGISGDYRANLDVKPQILVGVRDLGMAPIPTVSFYEATLRRSGPHTREAVKAGLATLYPAYNAATRAIVLPTYGEQRSVAAQVPRFAIRRSTYVAPNWTGPWMGQDETPEWIGIDVNFRPYPDGDAKFEQANYYMVTKAPIWRAASGALRVACIMKSTQNGIYVGWVREMNQRLAEQGTWDLIGWAGNLNVQVAELDASATIVDAAVCTRDDDTYLAVFGHPSGDTQGYLWVFQFMEASETFVLLTEKSKARLGSHQSWTPVNGGAIVCTADGFLLARGLKNGSRYKVAFARSTDGRTWDAPRIYTASLSITGGNTIHDAAGLLPLTAPGDQITLAGTSTTVGDPPTHPNDRTFTVTGTPTTSDITVIESLTNEAAHVFTVSISPHNVEFISDYRARNIELLSSELLTSLAFANADLGWAVTTAGRIFGTRDGGASWIEQRSPAYSKNNVDHQDITLHCVACVAVPEQISGAMTTDAAGKTITGTSGAFATIYQLVGSQIDLGGLDAAGANGRFTIASGSTSTVLKVSEAIASATGTGTVMPVATAFACGDHCTVLKTSTSGSTWSVERGATARFLATDRLATFHAQDADYAFRWLTLATTNSGWLMGDGAYIFWIASFTANQYAVVSSSQSGAYTCGSRHPTTAGSAIIGGEVGVHSKAVALGDRMKRFTHLSSYVTPALLDVTGVSSGDQPIVAVQHVPGSSGNAYALDRSGAVLFFNGSAWSLKARLPGANVAATNLQIPGPSDANLIIAVGVDDVGGLVWRSVDAGVTWVSERVPIRPSVLHFVGASGTDVSGIVGGGGVVYTESWEDDRIFTALFSLSTGGVCFATCNVTKQRLEVYRADSASTPFALVYTTEVPEAYTGLSSWSAPSTAPLPCFTQDLNGDLLLSVGQGGYVSLDEGRSWRTADDPALSVPFGHLHYTGAVSSTYINQYRQLTVANGRPFSSVLGDLSGAHPSAVRVFSAREWTADGGEYMPIWAGVKQWLGINDVYGVWSGLPAAGDQWTIRPTYRYPARHLVVSSPSVVTRSVSNSQHWTEDWKRADQAIVDVLGDGEYWGVSGGALFGTNFLTAQLWLSRWDFASQTFLTDDPAGYDVVQLSAAIQADILISGAGRNYVTCPDMNWTPDQWAPGLRQYFAQQSNSSAAYRILGNTANKLLLDYSGTQQGWGTVTIFSDRLCGFDSTLRTPRWVRLYVPNSSTPGQAICGPYRQIGTAIPFRHVTPSAGWRRHGGMVWQPVPFTIAQTTIAGVTSVEFLRRPAQRWQLPYEWVPSDDRNARVGPLLPHLGGAFGIVFRANEPAASLELVRLESGLAATNVALDRWTETVDLGEVV